MSGFSELTLLGNLLTTSITVVSGLKYSFDFPYDCGHLDHLWPYKDMVVRSRVDDEFSPGYIPVIIPPFIGVLHFCVAVEGFSPGGIYSGSYFFWDSGGGHLSHLRDPCFHLWSPLKEGGYFCYEGSSSFSEFFSLGVSDCVDHFISSPCVRVDYYTEYKFK